MLVAILVAGGVISGLLALVADLGQLYAERRVVQNGADAAALAIAQDCATGLDGCEGQSDAESRAEQFANANAPDDVTAVTQVCGPDGEGLTTCPAPGDHWADCQAVSQDMPHYVRVRTSTLRPDEGTFLLPIFAGLLADEGNAELGTGACAQAGWGPPSTAYVQFPLLVPVCPGGWDEEPVTIEDFDPNDPVNDACVLDGVQYPGVTKGFAFGSFPDAPKDCLENVPVSVGDFIPVETSVTQWCGSDVSVQLDQILAEGEPFVVPVVGDHTNQGQGQYEFEVLSFKSFTLLGYKVKNKSGGEPPNGANWAGTACHKSAKRSCFYGFFGPAVTTGTPGGGPDLGVRAVGLIP